MRRHFALVTPTRPLSRGATSVACLAFVVLLAIAFWAGALWIGEFLFRVSSLGY